LSEDRGLSWKTIIIILRNGLGHFPSQLKRSEREDVQLLSFAAGIRLRGAQLPVCLHEITFTYQSKNLPVVQTQINHLNFSLEVL
jgi:hypothetical protein